MNGILVRLTWSAEAVGCAPQSSLPVRAADRRLAWAVPRNPDKAIRYELASKWLRKAEAAADLEPQEGTLWHAYRRIFATLHKDLSDARVMKAAGWGSRQAFHAAYQQTDDETLLRVVEHEAELREVK